MFNAYVAAFLFIACLCIGLYFFGYVTRRVAILQILSLEIICGALFITPILIFYENLSVSQLFMKPQKENWLWLGFAGIFGFIGGNYFSLLNLKSAGERTNSLLSPAITASVILISPFFFNEQITFIKFCGFALTLGSVIFFLLSKSPKSNYQYSRQDMFSGMATIICLSIMVLFSIRGTMDTQISIMHSVWLRLIIVLPFAIAILISNYKKNLNPTRPHLIYAAISIAVVAQTILASYLWFYCSYKLGIATFQVLISTLPLFVYFIDVCFLKKTKASPIFLTSALLAGIGILIASF